MVLDKELYGPRGPVVQDSYSSSRSRYSRRSDRDRRSPSPIDRRSLSPYSYCSRYSRCRSSRGYSDRSFRDRRSPSPYSYYRCQREAELKLVEEGTVDGYYFIRCQREAEMKLKEEEEETTNRFEVDEEAIKKSLREILNSYDVKLKVQKHLAVAQPETEKEVAIVDARRIEEQAKKVKEELEWLAEENRRRVEEAQRREALEQGQKEEALLRKKQQEEEEHAKQQKLLEETTDSAVKRSFSESSSADAPSGTTPAIPFMPGATFPGNPFEFSSMDPSVKKLAEQKAKDPPFNQMAEQLQKTFQGGEGGIPQFDTPQYHNTMPQVMQNFQFMSMAERLGSALVQDPSMSQMLESLSNPTQKKQLEERMARIKKDPSLKHILEEIVTSGPTAMMRYWNDKDVVKQWASQLQEILLLSLEILEEISGRSK